MRKILLPPLILFACLGAMIALKIYAPMGVWLTGPLTYIGVALMVVGGYIPAWGVQTFKKAETNLMPYNDPDSMVTGGPFRFSRNPMYLGMLILLIGVAIILGTKSSLIVPPIFFAIINWYHIPFEESRMAAHFGDGFEEYKSRVRRWV